MNITVTMNPIYKKHLNNKQSTQIFFGGSSSGKSFFIAQKIVIDCLNGVNWLCCRNVAGTIRSSVFNQIVKTISDMSYGKSVRIARTESHRNIEAGQNDSAQDISSALRGSGMVYVSIWRSMGDGRVRDAHASMDGKMIEVGDKFKLESGVYTKCPGNSGLARHDCNCRCFLEYDVMTEEEFEQKGGKRLDNSDESGIIEAGTNGAADSFDRKARLYSNDEDLHLTNPNYSTNKYEWTHNCQRCVSTYEMRRRGYNVTAKPLPTSAKTNGDYLMSYPEAAWSGAQRVWCMKGSGKYQVETQMKNWGEGARAVVHVGWSLTSGGHVFCAEVKDGKIIYVDPQIGSSDCSSYFKRAMKNATWIFRVDNLLPTDAIKDCCGNIGGIL